MSNIDIEGILSSFQRTRLDNLNIETARKQQIYEAIPAIKDIDDTIAASSLSAAKARILKKDMDLAQVKEKNKALTQEKYSLLQTHGYPATYLSPIYQCEKCKDTGYVDGNVCSCLRQRIIDELYKQSNIKNLLKKENFDNFCLDYYDTKPDDSHKNSSYENAKNILKKSKKFVEEFDKERPGILIYGETGLGKTFLSNCIAKALLDRGKTVLYLSSINLFENILSDVIMNTGASVQKQNMYNYIFNCDLLIIDDLGTEVSNTFVLSQLFEIINKRSNQNLSTVISTNLSMKEFQKRYTERIVSRIVDSFLVFNFYGYNIRYQKRKKLLADNTK